MDIQQLKDIISLFEDSTIYSMNLEIDNMKVHLEKYSNKVEVNNIPVNIPTEVVRRNEPVVTEEKPKDYVCSPLVGTFYSSASPDAPAFVQVGCQVKKGDTLCIIEAMKVMNEIKAPKDGVVTDIKVTDGDMVQFNQQLIAIG